MLLCVVVCKRGGEVSFQLSCVRRYLGGGGVVGRDPGSSAFLTPGSGIWDPGSEMSRKSASGSRIRDPG
jgi:hypothetical protein